MTARSGTDNTSRSADAEDPYPLPTSSNRTPIISASNLPPIPRFLIIGASLVIVVAGMRAAAPIIVPITIALFLAVIGFPLLAALRRSRVPTPIAVGITVVTIGATLAFVMIVVSQSFTEFVNSIPRYALLLQARMNEWLLTLQDRGITVAPLIGSDLMNTGAILDLVRTTVARIAGMMATTVLVLIILVFILAEVSGFPAKMRMAMNRPNADLTRFARITQEIQRFLVVKTLTSLSTGILVGLWTWILGIDFPLLWGLTAFLLNYIPAVGSIVAAIPPILLALLEFGISRALAVALGYLVVNVVIGNLIEPNMMGRRLGLSALVVVLSLIFWGWVLGPVGMFFSVPLTVVVKIWLENTNDFRWMAVLLGPPTTVPPPEIEELERRGVDRMKA